MIDIPSRGQRVLFSAPNVVTIEPYEIPALEAGQALIASDYSLLSNGTECIALEGRFSENSHWARWVRYPFCPGYSCSGTVVALGSPEETLRIGDRVVLRAPHQSHHIVSAQRCIPIPKDIDSREAIWLALARIAFFASQAAMKNQPRRVLVVGGGCIGQLVLRWLSRYVSTQLALVTPHASQQQAAINIGVGTIFSGRAGQAYDSSCLDYSPETIIDCTADPNILPWALEYICDSGNIVIAGDTAQSETRLVTASLLLKGLTIRGIHDRNTTGGMNNATFAAYFFAALTSGSVSLNGLQDMSLPSHQAAAAYELIQAQSGALGIVLGW